MKTLNVHVTQEHIDKGKQGNCYFCPVALAITPHGAYYSIISTRSYEFVLYLCDKRKEAKLPTPEEVLDFINRFDAGKTVKPFSFALTIPEQLEEYFKPTSFK
jgi:hypothetical protein